jgi:hypothetical protein
MSSVFDRLFASAPLDKTAGSVVSAGESYTPAVTNPVRFWEAPPPTRRVADAGPEFVDFTGRTIGRLTVIGVLDQPADSRGVIAWVVRCVCGIYETRKSKALKRGTADCMCQFCNHTQRLRRRGSQQRSVEDFLADARGGE